MVSAREIFTYIDSIAPFDTQMSFDNAGLLTGSMSAESQRVMVALDASVAVIREAAQAGAKILVTHHPVIFHPLRSLPSESPAFLAAKYDITIISAHTNLDIAPGGVNDTLAELLGVSVEERYAEDCVLVGSVESPMSCREYARDIIERLGLTGLRYTDCGRPVKRVAVACGAGGDNVSLAEGLGADALVTGEIKHNYLVEALDRGVAVFDLGHFGSEAHIVPRLVKLLSERFPDTEWIRAENDRDGVMYMSE